MEGNLSVNITTEGEKNITFPVEGREDLQGYYSKENTDSELGLVLIQEWWGLNKSITITADNFAKKGFRVVIPDIYRGKVGKNHEEAGHLYKGLDFDGAAKDVAAAGQYLKSIGCKKVGVTGFCMGGALAIASLTIPNVFDAGVPFYGIPDLSKYKLENIKVPVLGHFGELDKAVGFCDVAAAKNLEEKAKAAGVNFTLHIWEGADHAFMNQDSKNYNPTVAKDALEETVEFFKKM